MYNIIMSDNHYYHKYLKYKTKYLNLKNDIDGGKKPLTKEKFNEEVKKIKDEVLKRYNTNYQKFYLAKEQAKEHKIFLNNERSKCGKDNYLKKNNYSSAGSCERSNNSEKEENKEATNTNKINKLDGEFFKIFPLILQAEDIKNSNHDFGAQLEKLKSEQKIFKKSFPISWF